MTQWIQLSAQFFEASSSLLALQLQEVLHNGHAQIFFLGGGGGGGPEGC